MLRTRTRGVVAAAVVVLLLAPATFAAVPASASRADDSPLAARSLIEWAGDWLGNALRIVAALGSTAGGGDHETNSPADPDEPPNSQPTAPEDASDVGPEIDPNG